MRVCAHEWILDRPNKALPRDCALARILRTRNMASIRSSVQRAATATLLTIALVCKISAGAQASAFCLIVYVEPVDLLALEEGIAILYR